MRRALSICIVAGAALATVLIGNAFYPRAASLVGNQYYSGDLPRSTPLEWLLFPDDTRYAPAFMESAFSTLRRGMTIDDVKAALGDPLQITEATDVSPLRTYVVEHGRRTLVNDRGINKDISIVIYYYALPGPQFKKYYVRNVTFDSSGHVVRITGGFHGD